MDTTLPVVGRRTTDEQIFGYVLQERIGAGGYGEVWSAIAPGGLQKAFKFVFGAAQDERAARELNALARIKEVHHPFLLSLERIEVWNGQLVIVTELADGSLKDRFRKYCDQGQAGIPRGELLAYLADAADALDFLFEKHSLQHLDVKPENLLLVGDHAKVGDFGLLKDLEQTCVSLVGGLSPTYSPPELFDGQPNRHSDQYSMAIVYQEMLTGERPFLGRTTAQLAAQHMHSAPNLDSLPLADRAVIGRALSKRPLRRYSSCRELIQQLRCAQGASSSSPIMVGRAAPAHTPEKTQVVAGSSDTDAAECSTQFPTLQPIACQNLPAIDCAEQDEWMRPTMVVGVGGTAATVLQHLRRRLTARFGAMRNIPAIQMVLLETDATAVAKSRSGEGDQLADRDTLTIPLRTAKDYREIAPDLLAWMSRRWLFNIPRSGRTEGIRPLGRLALVDHLASVMERLNDALTAATSQDSLTESERNTGLKFQSRVPRVLLVASISGGTGGGAALDLAYAVRHVLRTNRLSDEDFIGVLTHATSRQHGARDLATANAYAFLNEMQHFCHPENVYLGASPDLLPGSSGAIAPFRDAYLVHLGEDLSQQQFTTATDMLAAYIDLNVATPAADCFGQLRRVGCGHVSPPGDHLSLRTFAVAPLSWQEEEKLSVSRWLADANPRLADCARIRRVLVAAPRREGLDQLIREIERQHSSTVTTIDGCGNDVSICSEMEALSLPHVVHSLTHGNEEFARVASRIHTRTDIQWMLLSS
jgi:eukaryotic-like serine/threonine-protein kinase